MPLPICAWQQARGVGEHTSPRALIQLVVRRLVRMCQKGLLGTSLVTIGGGLGGAGAGV